MDARVKLLEYIKSELPTLTSKELDFLLLILSQMKILNKENAQSNLS